MSNVKPARKHGYVNWTIAHEYIKTMKWRAMEEFTNKCGELERTGKATCFHFYYLHTSAGVINEDKRFPEKELYLNISHPAVWTELLYINEQRGRKEGILKHIIDITKDQVHTRSSFEEKYGLRWVDPSEVPEVTSELDPECGLLTTVQLSEEATEPMQEQRPLTTMQVPEVPAEPRQEQSPLTTVQVSEVKTETTQEHRSPLISNDSPSNPVRSDHQHIPGVMDQEVADSDSNPIIATNENQDQNNLKTRELVQKLSQIKDKLNLNEFNNLQQELKTLKKWIYDESLKEIVQKVIDSFSEILLDLTENKCMVLYDELITLEISDEIQSELFVDTLLSWSQTIEEPIWTKCIAKVYKRLSLNKKSSDDNISFKTLFLNKLQSEFEKIISHNRTMLNMMMEDKKMNTNKVTAVATIRLISELYLLGNMVTTEMFENIIRGLTERLEEEEILECLYELIQITGEKLQKEESKELPIALRRMVQYIDHNKISSSVLSMINKARHNHSILQ